MTNEDKKLIADYMKWSIVNIGTKKRTYVLYVDNINCNIHHHFDANSASICAQEMQKRGEFIPFVNSVCYSRLTDYIRINFIAWLFNADNFFNTFVQWRKTK